MIEDIAVIGENQKVSSVGRRMREPVAIGAVGHALNVGAVGTNAPDLHAASAAGVEVDPRSIRRPVRPVVAAFALRQSPLFAAFDRDRIDIEDLITNTAIGQCAAIRRPAVPVGREVGGDKPRSAARSRQQVDRRLAELGLVADRNRAAIRRNAVVIVAEMGKAGFDLDRLRAVEGQPVKPAVAIDDEISPVRRPIRRLDSRSVCQTTRVSAVTMS